MSGVNVFWSGTTSVGTVPEDMRESEIPSGVVI